ncbi:hypothetical protein WJX74_006212 [Apatococcus lobatus]|uniref:Enoyl reductase (ER) domain-containing protein n=1 Tax=Apatococcus lobatus TaxID=904363 RepID=A0AAW1QAQ1_9CHLO
MSHSGQQTAVTVVQFNREDPGAALQIRSIPIPRPGKGEALCRMYLRPINPSDVYSIQGLYPGFRPTSLPAVPGVEGLGIVEAHGEGAGNLKIGQRVVAIWPTWPVAQGNGTWQQYICVNEDILVAVPDGMADEVAAQFLVNPITAVGMLEILQIPQGEWLVQDAAASVLGRQMIQYARLKGVKTINIVRRPEQAQELLDLGADVVVCSSTEDVVAQAKAATGGRGAYGGIDAVAGDTLAKVISSVRRKGTILNYGTLSGQTYSLEDAQSALEHATKDLRGGKAFLKG